MAEGCAAGPEGSPLQQWQLALQLAGCLCVYGERGSLIGRMLLNSPDDKLLKTDQWMSPTYEQDRL